LCSGREGSPGWQIIPARGSGEATATEVGGLEVGLMQCSAVEPHPTSRSIQVLPETEGQVEVVTEIDHAVEGESQLVVLQELQHR
jgi:hypothetical protein